MAINSYRDLRVWQEGMAFVEEAYRITARFPRHELHGPASQLQRASVSIPSNIAEGHTREHTKEYLRHVSIARASLAEADTQGEVALRLGYVSSEELEAFTKSVDRLGR